MLPQLRGTPLMVTLSGATGRGVEWKMIARRAQGLSQLALAKVKTRDLNDWLAHWLYSAIRHPPSTWQEN